MKDPLSASYSQCREFARRTARNFYYSFLVLPRAKRRAMCALYAFLRRTDDIGDSARPVQERRRELDEWRRQLDATLAGGRPRDLWWLALRDTVDRYAIPAERLHDVVDGVASDLDTFRYATFDELHRYCYRVASAVGLACIRVWGAQDPRADRYAEWCGIAFQLTNVLRDLVEDFGRGRIYLPQEDLAAFGVGESVFEKRTATPEFLDLMKFQIDRARTYLERSLELAHYLPPSGRAVYCVMRGLYGGLLEAIARSPESVLTRRVSLSMVQKVGCVARGLPVRYLGWSGRSV
jgi:phytoene synthase